MKNAKKSLALLLALVMIFGLGTIGASAAFNDAASIDPAYADAVNVMAGMGILIGNENGDFNPTGNLTRAQAAKMVTYMMLGKDAAERLPAKAMFNDVKVTDWSAKYVYYLANKKIINGYGNGNFGPNDTVTATQLAKMLLAAVGYGQADEFVGLGWDINVFALAVELGLYDGTKATDYDIAATREEAALYVFNTMTTIPLVKYSKDDGYDYKDAAKSTYATSKYNYDEVKGVITATKAGGSPYTVLAYVNGTTSVNLNLNIDVSDNLVGHKVAVTYSDKLEKDSNGIYYCNTYTVTDLSKEVAMFLVPYKTLYSNIGGNKATMLAYDSTKTKTPADSFAYWINNVDNTYVLEGTTGKTYGENFTTANTVAGIKASADIMPPASCWVNGSLIIDDTYKIIGFKSSSYTVEEVKKITTTPGSESITLSFTGEIKNSAKEDYVVEYDGIAKGDYVSVTKTGDVYTLQKCTVVKDVKVTSIGTDAFTTINGTYMKSSSSKLTSDTITIGGTYDFYMDKNNMYACVKEVSGGIKNLSYVSYIYYTSPSGSTGTYNCYAKCVGTDGTVTDYLITPAEYQKLGGTLDLSGNPTGTGAVAVEKLYAIKTVTDTTYYYKQTVATFDNTSIVSYNQTFNSNYRVAETLTNGNYLLANDVEYIYVSTDVTTVVSAPKTIVSISKTKPSASSGAFNIFFYPDRVSSDSTNYEVDQIFIKGSAKAIAGTSYIYSSGNDTVTRRPSNIGHTALNEANGIDYYLYAFIDKDYLKTFKLTGTDSNFDSSGYLKPGFYSYEIDSDGYYTLKKYDGTASGDKNVVVDCETLIGIYNNMITTASVIDLNAADAAIIDFTGYGLTTLEQLDDYLRDGYTIKISCWSYLYEEYAGTSKATTTTIYVNSITKAK